MNTVEPLQNFSQTTPGILFTSMVAILQKGQTALRKSPTPIHKNVTWLKISRV